jgi:hypothetical protein
LAQLLLQRNHHISRSSATLRLLCLLHLRQGLALVLLNLFLNHSSEKLFFGCFGVHHRPSVGHFHPATSLGTHLFLFLSNLLLGPSDFGARVPVDQPGKKAQLGLALLGFLREKKK